MTGKELIKLLESYPEEMLEREIVISTQGPSIGPSFRNPVKTVSPGIDWDSDTLFIIPQKTVVDLKCLSDEKSSEYYSKMGKALNEVIK